MVKKACKVLFIFLIVLIVLPISFAENNTDDSLKYFEDSQEIGLSPNDDNPIGVDYYFNISADENGDGSIDSPYNELTLARLKSSSTIHLTNGEYNLTDGKTLTKLTIIGEDAQKTIIRCTGPRTGVFSIGLDNYLLLSNVTFIGFNFEIEGGTLQANNTIFKDGQAQATYSSATDLVNSASNSFGGAIYGYDYQDYYDTYLPAIILDNCTFENNYGEYGGAICMDNGDLVIDNSFFINNYAYNYGGAIAALYDASVRVKNTKFVNDYSINDAGGAIYLLHASLSAYNITAINCSATFGSVVTSLSSTTALSYINAINNTAKYDGGVVYQMYNGISIYESYFENNRALNGGAVFVDGAEIFTLENNVFYNNMANMTAGAVYSLLNNKTTYKNNTYSSNKAKKNDDFYEADSIALRIGNGNYTLFYNNSTINDTLPSYYSLIDEGLVTPVKDQQSGGNCWAFGALAALESSILKASGTVYDLSEENVKNIMQTFSDYGWSEIETNDGGYDAMSIAYLVSWLGPVEESAEEYDDYSMLSPVLNSITHVQNIVYLSRSTYTDNDAIKKAIMNYGAVSTGIYYDSTYFRNARDSYYYYGSSYANHAVAIVGWDDSYSKENFNYQPAGDGAWIVKNSWDTTWGSHGGYFYVSYYDTRLAEVGQPDASFAFIFNSTEKYDKNYQYDIAGKTDYLVTGNDTIWAQNIFTSTDNELLSAVSTYFIKDTVWDLFIYINDQLALNKSGKSTPGYYTIELGENIPVSEGDVFRVVFKFTSKNGYKLPISEKIATNKPIYPSGVSFISSNGVNWTDLYDFEFETEEDNGHTYTSQVACIKAFTILYELKPSIKLSLSNVYNEANISAVVYDQYENLIHSGEVTFNIAGENFTVMIENGKAVLDYVFDAKGSHNITANYKNVNSSVIANITKLNIYLSLDILNDKNNATLMFESPFNVNTTVVLNLNNKTSYLDIVNGSGNLLLKDLDYGFYNVLASVYDEDYASEIVSAFNITVSKTRIVAGDLLSYYTFEKEYSVVLEDIYGNPVVDRPVSFVINGKSYVATTDDAGRGSVMVKLDNSTTYYKVNVFFYGDDRYMKSSIDSGIYLKSSIILQNATSFISKSDYIITLLDFDGNPLSVSKANSITVDGEEYWQINDNSGKITFSLDFKTGSHILTVKNAFTGECISCQINIFNSLMENADITSYYLTNPDYKVRAYAENGELAKAGEIVKITINKKTYDVPVTSNGYAVYRITLQPGTYTITASYNGFEVSNKVVIKPLLITKNISKKKGKTVKFTAKLLNTNGKAVKGKKITFKFKGKKYTSKTNKKGVATLKLKNLKAGSYKIVSKYGKSSCTNTIKIKK